MIRNATRWLAREMEQERITLHLDLPPEGMLVHADRIQIEQVLVNIVQNAIDAIRDAGSERRRYRVRTSQGEDGTAEVLVDDTGIGFAAEVTARLYEPFFTTKPQGMGMGLAISRTIVELHHGRLSVGPRASGFGATVQLVAAPRFTVGSERAIDMTAVPTVFVVDDNPGVRKSLQALVEAAGLAVATYASATEFLEAWDAQRPGCLVLDVRLRGDSGLNLQDELRRRKATLPIIVMTGYADVPTSVRALKGGAIDFLRKPVPPKQLIARIREAIDIDRRTRDAGAQRAAVTDRIAQLTPREREVMDLLAVGNSSKAIAAALRISVRTVESHRRTVLRKLGVSSAAQLARDVARLQGS